MATNLSALPGLLYPVMLCAIWQFRIYLMATSSNHRITQTFYFSIIMNKKFIKVRTITDIAIAFILLITGIILVLLPTPVSVNIFGFFMLVIGIILLAILKTGWQDPETKERYTKKEIFFHQSTKIQIINSLEKHMELMDNLDNGKGEGLKMEIYYNKQNRKAFINLFEYVPYSYEPISPTFEYTIDKIVKLIG